MPLEIVRPVISCQNANSTPGDVSASELALSPNYLAAGS